MYKFLKTTLTIFGITVLCLLATEVCLRLFSVIPEKIARPVFYADMMGDFEPNLSTRETVQGNLPYTVTINGQGLRGKQTYSLKKPENTLRVLCIGDSFTYGVGVDDQSTYPELLKIYLSEKFKGTNIEVINAGVYFYDIVDEYDYYMEKGRLFGADIVILQYYVNDLEGMTRWFFRPQSRTGEKYSWLASTIRQTALYNLAASARHKLGMQFNLPVPTGDTSIDKFTQFLVPGNAEQVDAIFSAKSLDEKNYFLLQPYWEMYLKVLTTFRNSVEANGSKFLFLMIPEESQMSKYINAYSHALIENLRKDKIIHIDMLPELRKLSKLNNTSYYNSPYDMHLNSLGNTIVANAVSKRILKTQDTSGFKLDNNTPRYRAYTHAIKTEIRMNDNAKFSTFFGNGVLSARVAASNIETECIKSPDRAICFATPVKPVVKEGTLSISIDYAQPVSGVTIYNPRRVGAPGSGEINVSCAADGQEPSIVSQYTNADKSTPDGLENVEYIEVDFSQPAKHVTVQYLLQADAALFASDDSKDVLRKLQVIGYP